MSAPLLIVEDLVKRYPNGVLAADHVSFSVDEGSTIGIVGESGSGKSTTARVVLGLEIPDSGSVRYAGRELLRRRRSSLRDVRREVQVVPQNPQTSFNPRASILDSIRFHARVTRTRIDRAGILEMLERVGIGAGNAAKYPHELSGGQLQRCAIARALIPAPRLVVCDEAVSALDKSVQAQVLNLLADVQRDLGVAYVFISHDLAVVEHIASDVVVMRRGRIVESGPAAEIWADPQHEYTRSLLDATPEKRIERALAS